ncbi:hypothetical protein [Kribbella sindirgiensis]|uniref:Uncharacterized protein n=1 Tax=Kribbella sindirgiensis TaxID=1124744 RepID=A0A4R0I6F1_9ACTN|nr:hypothetical protein [Kribbella sindirgiensis]TCC20573.1 hypothetical protein E0H50_36700 [Kribbella sindirgiensis]
MTIPKYPGSGTGSPAGSTGPGGPPNPRKAWPFVAVALAAVALLAVFVGAALTVGGDGPRPGPTPTTVGPTYSHSPDPAVPSGEIWQWALGRNLWTDPGLAAYAEDLGTDWGDPGTDANVHSRGFQLTADSSGTVTAVTLYNDESALGYPAGETSFSAYQGSLPMGLTWNTTATDLGVVYGAANQTGGYGTEIAFTYVTPGGEQVRLSFAARHERDLPGSPIHSITVSR